MRTKISMGSDHAGFELKEKVKKFLVGQGYDIIDQGCYSSERADYPDPAHKVAEDVLKKSAAFGVLICGSGNGISMAANKHKGIRAALCWNEEVAALARQHNDANIISLPARFITEEESIKCVKAFLSSSFEGGRHQQRVEKIDFSC